MPQSHVKSAHAPAFDDSADLYQLRLLSLDAELKELFFSREISQRQYRSRQRYLDFLTNKLVDIRATWSIQSSVDGYDPLFPMPIAKECSPEEFRLCETHLADKARVLSKIARDTTKILKWVTVTVNGRSFPLRTNFYLSGLRSKISYIDGRLRDAEVHKKSEYRFIEDLEKEELPATLVKRPPLEVLKAVFQVLGERNTRIVALRKELRQETDRVGWMEKWLGFQEMKMTGYLPRMELPLPESLRELSKTVLKYGTTRESFDNPVLPENEHWVP
jgi:hypothetical protein